MKQSLIEHLRNMEINAHFAFEDNRSAPIGATRHYLALRDAARTALEMLGEPAATNGKTTWEDTFNEHKNFTY